MTSLARFLQCSTERRNYVEIFYADRFSGRYCLSFSSLLFSSLPPPICSHRTTWHFVSLQSFALVCMPTTQCTVLFCSVLYIYTNIHFVRHCTGQYSTVFRAVFVSLRLPTALGALVSRLVSARVEFVLCFLNKHLSASNCLAEIK